MLMKLKATEIAQVENRFCFIPAVEIATFTAVGTALGAEEADVIAGGTAKNLNGQDGIALNTDGTAIVDSLYW